MHPAIGALCQRILGMSDRHLGTTFANFKTIGPHFVAAAVSLVMSVRPPFHHSF
jgi:hypothetical protein